MRRLYVVPKAVWAGQAQDLQGNPLFHNATVKTTKKDANGITVPGDVQTVQIPVKNYDLFHPAVGSHYIDLDGTYILVSGDVDHSEYCQEVWHGNPDVARLPHPMWEGTVKLSQLLSDPTHAAKQFKLKHLTALANSHALSVGPQDTVLTLAAKAQAIHPLVRLSSIL